MMNKIYEKLQKTWFIDLDGTIILHGENLENNNILLEKSKIFFDQIDDNDVVVLTTARKKEEKHKILKFMEKHNLKCDEIICDLPTGSRILINDTKPSGYITAYSFSINRNEGIEIENNIINQ